MDITRWWHVPIVLLLVILILFIIGLFITSFYTVRKVKLNNLFLFIYLKIKKKINLYIINVKKNFVLKYCNKYYVL